MLLLLLSDNDDLRSRLEKEAAERTKETAELRDRLDKETKDLKDRLDKEIGERKVGHQNNVTDTVIKLVNCRLTETSSRLLSMKMLAREMTL